MANGASFSDEVGMPETVRGCWVTRALVQRCSEQRAVSVWAGKVPECSNGLSRMLVHSLKPGPACQDPEEGWTQEAKPRLSLDASAPCCGMPPSLHRGHVALRRTPP